MSKTYQNPKGIRAKHCLPKPGTGRQTSLKWRLNILLFLIIIFIPFLLSTTEAKAAEDGVGLGYCSWKVSDKAGNAPPNLEKSPGPIDVVNWNISSLTPGDKYTVHASCGGFLQPCLIRKTESADSNGEIKGDFPFTFAHIDNDIWLKVDDPKSASNPICVYHISPDDWKMPPTPTPEFPVSAKCQLTAIPSTNIQEDDILTITGKITSVIGLDSNTLTINISDPDSGLDVSTVNVKGMGIDKTFPITLIDPKDLSFKATTLRWPEGIGYIATAWINVADQYYDGFNNTGVYARCSLDFSVCAKNEIGCGVITTPTPLPSPTDAPVCSNCGPGKIPCQDNNCKECTVCRPQFSPTPIPPIPSLAPLCEQVADPKSNDQAIRDLYGKCDKCINQDHGIWTAIGCLPTDFSTIVNNYFLKFGIGIAGGIAFLYFVYGAFLIMTSAGNAEKVTQAKEIIVSAISGLLLIIFSIFFLKVIGVDILKIPGFGG